MRRTLPVLLLLASLATPAAAQQYWLPNGSGGTTANNPTGSLLGTMNEHMLQRHMAGRGTYGAPSAGGGTAVAPAATASPARGGDPSFRLTNAGGRTVRELYVSAATDSGWGVDRLGQGVLAPGAAFVVRLPAGQCRNDVRVVFADGTTQERRGVDTCGLTDVAVR